MRERRGNIAVKGCYQERIKEKLKRGMQGQGVKRVGIRCCCFLHVEEEDALEEERARDMAAIACN